MLRERCGNGSDGTLAICVVGRDGSRGDARARGVVGGVLRGGVGRDWGVERRKVNKIAKIVESVKIGPCETPRFVCDWDFANFEQTARFHLISGDLKETSRLRVETARELSATSAKAPEFLRSISDRTPEGDGVGARRGGGKRGRPFRGIERSGAKRGGVSAEIGRK